MIGRWLCCVLLGWPLGVLGQGADSTQHKRMKVQVFQIIGFEPESSWQFGVVLPTVLYLEHDQAQQPARSSSLIPSVVYTLRNQLIGQLTFDAFIARKYFVSTYLRFANFPDYYFGTGPATLATDREGFVNTYFTWNGRLYREYKPGYFLGLAFDVDDTRPSQLRSGGLLEAQQPTGVAGGFVLGLGPAFRLDTRNDANWPTAGSTLLLDALASTHALGSRYQYVLYNADYRRYFALGNENNVLAAQIALQASSGGQLPFYKMPRLGGLYRLRGMLQQRYIGQQAWYAQTEYRRPLFWRVGMVAYAGVGGVGASAPDFALDQVKYVLGLGARLMIFKKEKLNVRLDMGWGSGGESGVYVALREAF